MKFPPGVLAQKRSSRALDQIRRGARPTSAICTQQRDAECDPRALEHEQPDVVQPYSVEKESQDQTDDGDNRKHPSPSQRRSKIAGEEQLADEDEEESDSEQGEVVGNVTGPDQFDEDLDGEEREKDDTSEGHPNPNASKTRASDHLPQTPERERKRHEPGASEGHIDGIRNIVAKDQLAALPHEVQRTREHRGSTCASPGIHQVEG